MNNYEIGNVVTFTAVFKTASGTLVDPTAVYFAVKPDDGSTTIYTYGVGATIVRDSAGTYHIDLSATSAGGYWVRAYSTGTGQAAKETEIRVSAAHTS